MQQANSHISQAVRSIESAKPTSSERQSERKLYRDSKTGARLTKEEILWDRLGGLYGSKFERQYGSSPTPEWELILKDISPVSIAKGLDKLVRDEKHKTFAPTPMEFRFLCLPTSEELGLPSTEEAYQQAVGNRTKKHPSVIHALRQVDSYALRQARETEARAMFLTAWAATVDHVLAGGELPEPEPEIEHKPVRAAPDKAKPYIDQLMGML